MSSMLFKVTSVAVLTIGLFLTNPADSSAFDSGAQSVLLPDWLQVQRTSPILEEPALDADARLAAVATSVAAYTRSQGGLAQASDAEIADHLEQTYPGSTVTVSAAHEEYIWYVDENGELVRVCLAVSELLFTSGGADDPLLVRVRRQLEV